MRREAEVDGNASGVAHREAEFRDEALGASRPWESFGCGGSGGKGQGQNANVGASEATHRLVEFEATLLTPAVANR